MSTPTAPSPPFSLFFRVRARVLCSRDLPSALQPRMFVDQTVVERSAAGANISALKAMRDLTEDVGAAEEVLALMLREALADAAFAEALDAFAREPSPCFAAVRAGAAAAAATQPKQQQQQQHDEASPQSPLSLPAAVEAQHVRAGEAAFVERVLDETLSNILLELSDEGGL